MKNKRNWLYMFAVMQGIIEGSVTRAEGVLATLNSNGIDGGHVATMEEASGEPNEHETIVIEDRGHGSPEV